MVSNSSATMKNEPIAAYRLRPFICVHVGYILINCLIWIYIYLRTATPSLAGVVFAGWDWALVWLFDSCCDLSLTHADSCWLVLSLVLFSLPIYGTLLFSVGFRSEIICEDVIAQSIIMKGTDTAYVALINFPAFVLTLLMLYIASTKAAILNRTDIIEIQIVNVLSLEWLFRTELNIIRLQAINNTYRLDRLCVIVLELIYFSFLKRIVTLVESRLLMQEYYTPQIPNLSATLQIRYNRPQ